MLHLAVTTRDDFATTQNDFGFQQKKTKPRTSWRIVVKFDIGAPRLTRGLAVFLALNGVAIRRVGEAPFKSTLRDRQQGPVHRSVFLANALVFLAAILGTNDRGRGLQQAGRMRGRLREYKPWGLNQCLEALGLLRQSMCYRRQVGQVNCAQQAVRNEVIRENTGNAQALKTAPCPVFSRICTRSLMSPK